MSADFGELSADAEGARVRFTRRLEASADEVWAALTEPQQLRGWLAETTLDARSGTEWEARFAGGERATGTVVAVEPPRLLELTWAFSEEPESFVRFELHPDGEATLLVLEHRRLAAAGAEDYGAGWHAHLDLLAAVVSGADVPHWQARYEAVRLHYAEMREGG